MSCSRFMVALPAAALLAYSLAACRNEPVAARSTPPPSSSATIAASPPSNPATPAPAGSPSEAVPDRAAPPAGSPPESVTVRPADGVAVIVNQQNPAESRVEIQAWTCLEEGWLEQVACTPGTREHESLLVVKAKPSEIHYAMLLARFEPGAPGRWVYENDAFSAIDPSGDKVDVFVRYEDPQQPGKTIEHPVGHWIRGPGGEAFPPEPWVFAGSLMAPNPKSMGPGEHYVADFSGSVVGLVTFGDEVIGFARVLADEEAVQEPLWEANPDTMPPPETEVTLILKKFRPK